MSVQQGWCLVPTICDSSLAPPRLHRPPRTDEDLFRPPPTDGPYGLGTDWTKSITLRFGNEDVVNPPWCSTSANRSFVEYVMDRKREDIDRFNKVSPRGEPI